MVIKSKMISPHVRDTLEYAEAIRLLSERHVVEEHLGRIDEEIRLVRRISPSAVELARRDVAIHNSGHISDSTTIVVKAHG
jgi:hypothetical protein